MTALEKTRPPVASPTGGQDDQHTTCSIPPPTPDGKPWNGCADTSAQFLDRLNTPGNRLLFTGQPGDPMLRPRCGQCHRFIAKADSAGCGRLADGYRGKAWCCRCVTMADEAEIETRQRIMARAMADAADAGGAAP